MSTTGIVEGAMREVVRAETRDIRDMLLSLLAFVRQARPTDDSAVSQYLSASEAGRIAGVTGQTVQRWVRRGVLPGYYAGRVLRVRRDELERFLARPTDAKEHAMDDADLDARALSILERQPRRR